MKTNPELSNVVLIYLNTTFKSTLRNSTKFELNKYNMCSFLSKSFILSIPTLLYNRTNLTLHGLRHEMNNNLTYPFREIERKLSRNHKILWNQSLYSMIKKNSNRKKNHRKSLCPVFVFKKSLYDLSQFSKVESFWGITFLPKRVTVKLLELSHLGKSSLFYFSSLAAGVGVSTRCLLFLRRRDVRSRFGGFLH